MTKQIPTITIGCDPEVFVRQGGEFKSAHGLIVGDKKNPQKVDKGAVQVDGMALEFNTDPAKDENEFCVNVATVLQQLRLMVPQHEIVITPVAHFDAAYMKAQPPEALELGCDPDFNGWSGEVNIKPNADRPMRTASGHVHIGFVNQADVDDPLHMAKCQAMSRQMDFFLGLPSLFYDDDVLRREMYGKAGCLRYKPYGMEYRTLSNRWLASKELTGWVFRAAKAGAECLFTGRRLYEKYGDIQGIINNSDKDAAMKIIKAEKLEVCYG